MMEGSSGAVDDININNPPPPTELSGAQHHRALSRWRGVVPQSSGKWGAQIRAGKEEIELGTFDSEEEAARAYERAILKYRKPHEPMDILSKEKVEEEIKFQAIYTKEKIVEMIKDHSYDEKLWRFNGGGHGDDIKRHTEILFSKEVTHSDLRWQLVIPADYATRYFPLDEQQSREKQLVFLDEKGESWYFRYTNNQKQRYVLSKGWKHYMHKKNLKVGDLLLFERLHSWNLLTVIRGEEECHGRSVQPQGATSDVQSVQPQGETSHVQSVQPQGETSHVQSIQDLIQILFGEEVDPNA